MALLRQVEHQAGRAALGVQGSKGPSGPTRRASAVAGRHGVAVAITRHALERGAPRADLDHQETNCLCNGCKGQLAV